MRSLKPAYLYRPDQVIRRAARMRRRSSRMDVRLAWGSVMTVDGFDAMGWGIARTSVYELAVTEAMWRLLGPNDLAIDVGANMGYFTGLMTTRAGEVVSVEPHPQMAERLLVNVRRWSGECQVRVLEAAASDANGQATLGVPLDADHHGLAGLGVGGATKETFEVRTIALDDVVGDRRVGVMKVDIEGHELSALRGLSRALYESRIRDIFFEDHCPLPSEVSLHLKTHGYEIFGLVEHLRGVGLAHGTTASPSYDAPTYLATLDPVRAQQRVRPTGWSSLRPRLGR